MKPQVAVSNETKIDKGIPIPGWGGGRRGFKYPFHKMEIGDSAFFPGEHANGRVKNAADAWAKSPNGNGRKYSARSVTESGVTGVRIWRVA